MHGWSGGHSDWGLRTQMRLMWEWWRVTIWWLFWEVIPDSWLVIVTNLAYFNLKWSYNITSIHNKVWSESMQSAAIDSSTTIINPDPGLDLVRLTDGQTDTACYMLHWPTWSRHVKWGARSPAGGVFSSQNIIPLWCAVLGSSWEDCYGLRENQQHTAACILSVMIRTLIFGD